MIDEKVWRKAALNAWAAMHDVAHGAYCFNENVRNSMKELQSLLGLSSSEVSELRKASMFEDTQPENDKRLPPHEYTTDRVSAWAAIYVVKCVYCGGTFRSEHSAKFHTCES